MECSRVMAFSSCFNSVHGEMDGVLTGCLNIMDAEIDAGMTLKNKHWHRLVINCLQNIDLEDFKFNSYQCSNLCHAFTSKLSNYFCRPPEGPGGQRFSEEFESCEIVQRAWKEVYRVLKEAELYLQNCSSALWLKKSATLSTTGEAHALHIHDLLWSVICLDLSTLFRQSSYDAVACRKFGDFHAEMSNLTCIHDEYVDKKQLISTLRQEYEERDNSVEENNKVEIAKFLSTKLKAASPIEPGKIDTLPEWLFIHPDHLVISKRTTIGAGSYGAVYKGSWLGLDVAVKEIPSGAYDLFRTEALVLAKMQCPFIVQLIGTCVKEESCYIVMELADSSLDSVIKKRSGEEIWPPFPLHVGVDIMLQISRGMEYLHGQGIMHMDLKAANVLIEPSAVPEFREEGYCRVKLCDFGTAGLKLYSFRCSFPKGTTYWRAPEAFPYPKEQIKMDTEVPKEYTYKADVYSFAMTCYETLTGKQPFEGVPTANFYRRIVHGERPVLPPSCIPPLLGDYIKRCWDTDPCRRPCFKDVSMFLRYMKLLIIRTDDLHSVSLSSVCTDFDNHEISKCFEGTCAFSDERVTNEEKAFIIRALDGEFSLYSDPPRLPRQNAKAVSSQQKGHLTGVPDYIRKFSSEELWNATRGFSRQISGVSFAMWDGILSDGRPVIVAEINTTYLVSTAIATQLHHPNILRLLGTGWNLQHLVYDAAAMGPLDKWLFSTGGSHVLSWNIRRRIGLGIARSIAYLHGDCEKKILSVVLNSGNVLLDERFTPKLYGVGSPIPVYINPSTADLSAIQKDFQKCSSQYVKAVEFRDVYRFGIILLEILSGSRWLDMMYPSYDSNLHSIESKCIMNFLDKRLQGEVDESECRRLVHLALWCIVNDPFQRPNMDKVVLVMEGLSEFPAPPKIATLKWHRKILKRRPAGQNGLGQVLRTC